MHPFVVALLSLCLADSAHAQSQPLARPDSAGTLAGVVTMKDGALPLAFSTVSIPALGRELFTNVGIDPAQKRIVVVKSANHFRDAFGPIAEEVLYADGNGNVPINCRSHPFTKVLRPLWPLDPRPEGAFIL